MPEVEQPISAACPVCLLGLLRQAFPSTQLEKKENIECLVSYEKKLKESARRPIFPVNHAPYNTQVEIKENTECPGNQVE